MQQKIDDGIIFVKATKEEEAVIKTWRMMTKDKEKGYWYGSVSRPLLENLKRNGGLIPPAKKMLDEMLTIQAAVDAERVKPDKEVKPRYKYPVKAKLYKHQERAANMAMLIFGVVQPDKPKPREPMEDPMVTVGKFVDYCEGNEKAFDGGKKI